MKWLWVPLLLTSVALAANPQDEQVVRTAYAKLAFAVQSRTVYVAAKRNPKLTPSELAQKLKDSELRFEINDMSSGALSDIASRPYSDFVTPPSHDPALSISLAPQTLDENGQRFSSLFAGAPHWTRGGEQSQEDWNTPVKEVMQQTILTKFSRYVTATISVTALGKSRTYRALWLFGSNDADEALAVDLVAGQVVRDFGLHSTYPSVLTDTQLRMRPAVQDWLNSTQNVAASCKAGKQDVCCDAALHCGVAAADLRDPKPAPSTKAVPKGGL